ncbi:hypothetical protein T440DRAFT_463778 [Plenodomus tracheiphilus IPT5]|uniref:Uncharacterized protein n=1 Tax=Plenodomus tracheiphilus IPT5 TaxID=1408161 RepID=A0A6A7BPB4_9PLEO|nr:hypothetical protein T440DRAFT_463778 [Plenodomus tracheiphilus IPT5]
MYPETPQAPKTEQKDKQREDQSKAGREVRMEKKLAEARKGVEAPEAAKREAAKSDAAKREAAEPAEREVEKAELAHIADEKAAAMERKAKDVARSIVKRYSPNGPTSGSATQGLDELESVRTSDDEQEEPENEATDYGAFEKAQSRLFSESLMDSIPLGELHDRATAFVVRKPLRHADNDHMPAARDRDMSIDMDPTIDPTSATIHYEPSRSRNASLQVLTQMLEVFLTAVDILEPPPKPKSARLRWDCDCGDSFFEDFVELQEGGISRLIERMQGSTAKNIIRVHPAGTDGNAQRTYHIPAWIRDTQKTVAAKFWPPGPLLPRSHTEPSIGLTTLPGSNTGPLSKQLHMMTCMSNGQYGRKLYQDVLERISTDRELFNFMRSTQIIRRQGLLSTLFRLKCIQRIHFVKFRLMSCGSAEVRENDPCFVESSARLCECIPPAHMVEPAKDAQYKCDPAGPPDTSPPISSRQLMHWLARPECIKEAETFVLNQLPKRNCGELTAIVGKPVDGWGLLYEENWNYRLLISVLFALALLGSLVFAILWSCFEYDIQGVFGVSSYIIGTFGIFMMWVASQLDK